MRITGGQLTGLRLRSPRGRDIRPTSDRVREALFNILGQRLHDLRVLDLFAGTGVLGLEALSRGAAEAFFVDRSQHSRELILQNLALCRFQERGRFLQHDLLRGLPADLLEPPVTFDLVFLDPPYILQGSVETLETAAMKGIFSPGALAVIETSRRTPPPESIHRLRAVDTRIYGDTRLTFYQTVEEEQT
ncbi:Methyltransferase [uncultured Desulfatiglans sp.]|uniref:Methyltransferase n=1 Tax=Uncultured Desulfatiglans sp. TaxID=1748965 RepID=A0A653ADM1_UNCDX|nr:Methyltransferase [uncultured Desulfatiglans sp.]